MLSFISIQIQNVNLHLYRIRKISKSTNFKIYKSKVTCFVLSTLEYCNILLINFTAKYLEPLVKFKKRTVKTFYNLPHRSINNDISITSLMKKLYWLTVSSHIKYKLLVLTRDVNDAELLMPSRDYWYLMPSRDFHFRKKNEPRPSRDSSQPSPSRTDTLAKRARAELRLLQNITESK